MSLRPRFLAQATRYVYKTVFNLVDTDSNKFFSVIGNNSGTRGSAGLSPRVAPCQNLRGAHSTISVLIIEKS